MFIYLSTSSPYTTERIRAAPIFIGFSTSECLLLFSTQNGYQIAFAQKQF